MGNPVGFVDPDGLEVEAVYDSRSGSFSVRDLDKGTTAAGPARSGGVPFGEPIPPGNYHILERAGRPGFFRLDPIDSIPFNDKDDSTGRDFVRLHYPGQTIGCIASTDWKTWRSIEKLISDTKTGWAPDRGAPWWDFWNKGLKYYGTLTVR